MLRRVTVVALALCAGLASCAPPASGTTAGPPSHAGAARSATPATGLPAISITDRDNGRTLRTTVGQVVTIRLRRTTWTFDKVADVTILRPLGAPVVRRGRCAPGVGCGSVTLSVRAIAPGTAQVSASRRICGEVLLCRPEQRRFQVVIQVR